MSNFDDYIDSRGIEDLHSEDKEIIGSLCRLGGRPVSPQAQMEQEKRIRREIANSNERRRMQSINAGFQSLRTLLPHHEGEKLSKAAILQQTAEYIYHLEQEKTRLLSQNCHLKRMLNQHEQRMESSVSNGSGGGNGGGGTSLSDATDADSEQHIPPKRRKAYNGSIALLDGGGGEASSVVVNGVNASSADALQREEELRKELIEIRLSLDRERRLRLQLEEQIRTMDQHIFPDRAREIAQQKVQQHQQQQHHVVIQHFDANSTSSAPPPQQQQLANGTRPEDSGDEQQNQQRSIAAPQPRSRCSSPMLAVADGSAGDHLSLPQQPQVLAQPSSSLLLRPSSPPLLMIRPNGSGNTQQQSTAAATAVATIPLIASHQPIAAENPPPPQQQQPMPKSAAQNISDYIPIKLPFTITLPFTAAASIQAQNQQQQSQQQQNVVSPDNSHQQTLSMVTVPASAVAAAFPHQFLTSFQQNAVSSDSGHQQTLSMVTVPASAVGAAQPRISLAPGATKQFLTSVAAHSNNVVVPVTKVNSGLRQTTTTTALPGEHDQQSAGRTFTDAVTKTEPEDEMVHRQQQMFHVSTSADNSGPPQQQQLTTSRRVYVTTSNTSRQNLETIVEAIRHLEGDHLFNGNNNNNQQQQTILSDGTAHGTDDVNMVTVDMQGNVTTEDRFMSSAAPLPGVESFCTPVDSTSRLSSSIYQVHQQQQDIYTSLNATQSSGRSLQQQQQQTILVQDAPLELTTHGGGGGGHASQGPIRIEYRHAAAGGIGGGAGVRLLSADAFRPLPSVSTLTVGGGGGGSPSSSSSIGSSQHSQQSIGSSCGDDHSDGGLISLSGSSVTSASGGGGSDAFSIVSSGVECSSLSSSQGSPSPPHQQPMVVQVLNGGVATASQPPQQFLSSAHNRPGVIVVKHSLASS